MLNKLDTTHNPMHIMDGALKDGQYLYTADEGLYSGGDELENGAFTMHRVKKPILQKNCCGIKKLDSSGSIL